MPVSIKYVHPPPSPIRRMPRNTSMTEIRPSPWGCRKHRKACKTYADGVIWCEFCQHSIKPEDAIHLARGRQFNTPTPAWRPIRVD